MTDKTTENAAIASQQTYDAVTEPNPQAIVVYCSDPRFQQAFDGFIEGQLRLKKGEFIPLVVAGGAGTIANPEMLPKEFKFMKDRFDLFRQHHSSIKRIVLINHEDCAYYGMLAKKISGLLSMHAKKLTDQPHEDLKMIAQICNRLLSHLGLAVELYYAKFTGSEHSKVVFERINA